MSIQYALNGYHVFMVDLEGHGFSGGTRIVHLTIDNFHHSVSTLLEQVPEDLPCFLFGHSMGGLTVTSYLGLNPVLAERFAGVILSAPLLGFPDHADMNAGKKLFITSMGKVLGEFVMNAPMPLHKICRNLTYQRVILGDRKSNPFISMALGGSFIRNVDLVQTYAERTAYPYQLIMAEHDHLVCNKASRAWHEKTKSATK
jgi:alpha-beta hydrolase superfamily lysophospholipase